MVAVCYIVIEMLVALMGETQSHILLGNRETGVDGCGVGK